MPLPVQKATLPGNPTTVGGLPAIECPEPEAQRFDLTASFGWARAGAEGFDGLALGLLRPDDLKIHGGGPVDLATIQGETAFALPIGPTIEGSPTEDDLPGAMIVASPLAPGGTGAVTLPTPLPPEFVPEGYTPGDDLWLRNRIVTEQSRTIEVFYYLPGGIPQAYGGNVEAWAVARTAEGVGEFVQLIAPDPADPEDPPALDSHPIGSDVAGIAPPSRKSVAVSQGCNTIPFTVEGIAGGVPLAVTMDSGPPAPVEPGQLTVTRAQDLLGAAGEPAAEQEFPAGWVKAILQGVGPADGNARFLLDGMEVRCPQRIEDGNTFYGLVVIDAPAGTVMPSVIKAQSQGGGLADSYANAAVYYPVAP